MKMGDMKQKSKQLKKTDAAIVACSFTLTATAELQLFPAGEFRSVDGRPTEVDFWFIDAAIAAVLIADLSARKNRIVIDYEHQTLLSKDNGKPAPAAGWFKTVEWREGEGLFATDVEWTATAQAHIEAKEYLYFSPVFAYSKTTGAVQKILLGAVTNSPALDGMSEATITAASQLLTHTESLTMDLEALLERLRWMFNLPTLATTDDILVEVNKAVDLIKAENATAAASFNLIAHLSAQHQSIASLTAQVATPDPAKFVPVTVMQDLQTQLAALNKKINEDEVNDLVTVALSDSRLLPTQEAWARSLGESDIAALRSYIATAQPIVALTATQTGGNIPEGDGITDLTESQLAVCKQMGVSPEDYKKTLQASA